MKMMDMVKHGAIWSVDEESGTGTALIDRDIDGDRWQWRITEHEI